MTSADAPSGSSFYIAGGTLRPDAPSYVERQADRDLYEGLSRGEYCYVLTSRQMGKSSLMVRTAVRLRAEGVAVAAMDLTSVGQNLTAEQWYEGLLFQLGQQLGVEDALEEFWLDHERLGPMHRLLEALRAVVLPSLPPGGRLVVFVDELDAVLSLPFSTDEFFAGIRECYTRRAQEPALQRLAFCLLGVASPSDLIRDTRLTPFNIGRRIELNDFNEAEAAPLAQALGSGGAALLRRVLHWTGGHPYLTQRLCRAVAEDAGVTGPAAADGYCEVLFLSKSAQEKDDNLLFVRDRLLRSEVDAATLLDLYGRVRGGRRVRLDDTDPAVGLLRLSGIVRVADGLLVVRNRIYARVFDREWVIQHTPDAELRRQRAAYRRGLARATMLSGVVLGLVGALAWTALSSAAVTKKLADDRRVALVEAQSERDRSADLLYASQMNLAHLAYKDGRIVRARRLLEQHLPQPGQTDRRDFVWGAILKVCGEFVRHPAHTGADPGRGASAGRPAGGSGAPPCPPSTASPTA